jgi:hypothetical protein
VGWLDRFGSGGVAGVQVHGFRAGGYGGGGFAGQFGWRDGDGRMLGLSPFAVEAGLQRPYRRPRSIHLAMLAAGPATCLPP